MRPDAALGQPLHPSWDEQPAPDNHLQQCLHFFGRGCSRRGAMRQLTSSLCCEQRLSLSKTLPWANTTVLSLCCGRGGLGKTGNFPACAGNPPKKKALPSKMAAAEIQGPKRRCRGGGGRACSPPLALRQRAGITTHRQRRRSQRERGEKLWPKRLHPQFLIWKPPPSWSPSGSLSSQFDFELNLASRPKSSPNRLRRLD